ncbi:MAG: FecR domain-containing protein [Bacteroidota bacterium]
MEEQLGKYFSGEATEQEILEIRRWRNESEENARSFLESKRLWVEAGMATIEAPKEVLKRIVDVEEKSVSRPWTLLRYAAVISLLLAMGWWFFLRPTDAGLRDELLPMVEIHQLEDGTKLNLYRGSSFSVVKMTEDQRIVRLQGKGFFDVVRDEERPFVVETEHARVEVLGTSFVVDTKALEGTEVLVASGKVSMAPKEERENADALLLEVGDKGVLADDASVLEKRDIANENFMAWSSGVLSFKEEELADVGEVLKEVYGLQVSFTNSEAANCQLTAKYRRKSREEVVRLIADTFDMKYRIKGNQVQFSGRACQ